MDGIKSGTQFRSVVFVAFWKMPCHARGTGKTRLDIVIRDQSTRRNFAFQSFSPNHFKYSFPAVPYLEGILFSFKKFLNSCFPWNCPAPLATTSYEYVYCPQQCMIEGPIFCQSKLIQSNKFCLQINELPNITQNGRSFFNWMEYLSLHSQFPLVIGNVSKLMHSHTLMSLFKPRCSQTSRDLEDNNNNLSVFFIYFDVINPIVLIM